MIKFSWEKINNKFDWNAYSVLEYFYLKQEIPIPLFLNRKIPKIVKKAALAPYINGDCFLINPNGVLENATSPGELYLYLEVASKRNVFDYLMRNITYLPIALVPEHLIEWVNVNPLMKVDNRNVYFKYEQEKQ